MSLTIGCDELAEVWGLKNGRAFARKLDYLIQYEGFPRPLPGSRRMFSRSTVESWLQHWASGGTQTDPRAGTIAEIRERFKAGRRVRQAA